MVPHRGGGDCREARVSRQGRRSLSRNWWKIIPANKRWIREEAQTLGAQVQVEYAWSFEILAYDLLAAAAAEETVIWLSQSLLKKDEKSPSLFCLVLSNLAWFGQVWFVFGELIWFGLVKFSSDHLVLVSLVLLGAVAMQCFPDK